MRTLALFLLAALLSPGQQGNLVPLDESGFRKLLASSEGKVVLVDFWATWCVPCRKEFPQILGLEKKFRARGLKLITVSCDEPEQLPEAVKFLRAQNASQPSYVKQAKNDDQFINAIDPKWSGALPALFVYDRQGHKVKSFIGETGTSEVEAALNPLFGTPRDHTRKAPLAP
jgi:thiol-disulfide isomerase/thioredoxin